MKTSRSVYADTDLLIWVGSGTYKTIESYVNEVRQQGCSRRLSPDVLNWVVPGRTRVFLAHKGDQQADDYGVLFGYFTVSAIHIFFNDTAMDWTEFQAENYTVRLTEGIRRPQSEGEVRRQFNQWVARDKIVVHRQSSVSITEQDPIEMLIDELGKDMLKGALKKTLKRYIIRYIPASWIDDIPFRLCGSPDIGAYLVDELADELLDKVIDLILNEGPLNGEYYGRHYKTNERPGQPIRRRRIKRQKIEPGVSPSGRFDCAKIGDRPKDRKNGLVVFEQPYPLYCHPPTASFRGLRRLDGDALLLKIKQGKPTAVSAGGKP